MGRRVVKRLLPAVLAALAAAPGPALAADETTNHRIDAQHSGGAPDSPVTPPLRMRWRADLGRLQSNVIVAGNRVFYVRQPSTGLKLTALDVASGRELWSQDVTPWVLLAYDEGRLYAVGSVGEHGEADVLARALDPATGAELWSKQFEESYGLGWFPTAAGGQLFFVGHSGYSHLYGLRGSDGASLWPRQSLSSGGHSSPAVDDTSVYVSLAGHQTYAFERSTGELRWHNAGCCTGGGGTNPIVRDGLVYAERGLVHRASDGLIVGREIRYFPFFLGDGGVQLSDQALRGFGPDLATTRWQVAYDTSDVTAPLPAGSHVFLGGTSHSGPLLRVLRNSDGGEAWCQRLEFPPGSESSQSSDYQTPPVAAGNGVVIVSVGYGLAAFESGGQPSTCGEPGRTPATAPPRQPAATAVSPTAAAGPALRLSVGRRKLYLGQRTNVAGALRGMPGLGGHAVALELDEWPFDDRWVVAERLRTAPDGTFAAKLEPRRNVRIRARLVADPRATTNPIEVFADFPWRARVRGRGGPRPTIVLEVAAFRGAQIRRKRVYGYLTRGRTRPWRLVARKRWTLTRRSATVRLRYPRGRLGRRDHWLVCVPERVPDAFGRPSEIERRCGARTLPRGLS